MRALIINEIRYLITYALLSRTEARMAFDHGYPHDANYFYGLYRGYLRAARSVASLLPVYPKNGGCP
jgi:hypothetical protein